MVKGIDLGAALLWLLRGKSGPAWCVPAAGAAVGACCARVPPVSHGGFWKNFLFYVACLAALFALEKLDTSPLPSNLSAYSGVLVLPVEFSVLDFLEVRQCIHVLRGLWKNLHIFYEAVNSNPEAFGLHSCRMEKRAQSMLLVAASLSAVRRLEVDIVSTSAPLLTVCGNSRCVVQHFSEPSMMKNSSSSRAHAN